jgi:hypothetical protein
MAFGKKKEADVDNAVYHGRVEKNGYTPMNWDIEEAKAREPHTVVRFQNLDNKKVNIPFSKNLPAADETGAIRKNAKGEVIWNTERYNLEPGKLYCLPNRIINELADLKYPIYEDYIDPETKQSRSVVSGWQPRFALTIEGLSTEINKAAGPSKKKGSEPKEVQV